MTENHKTRQKVIQRGFHRGVISDDLRVFELLDKPHPTDLEKLHIELESRKNEVLKCKYPAEQYLQLKSLEEQEELDDYYGVGKVN